MRPRTLLRLEGLAVFVAATGWYLARGESPLVFALLFLLPDLSMVGYLVGDRWGSRLYDAVHTYLGPAAVLGVGLLDGRSLAVAAALIWIAHVGADRSLGFGLKYPDAAFGDTHLQRV